MQVLIITSQLPYPLVSGGRVGTFQMIRGLSKTHQITLLFPIYLPDNERNIAELRKLLPNVEIILCAPSLKSTRSKKEHVGKRVRKWVEQKKVWRGFQTIKGVFSPSSFVYRESGELKQHILNRFHAGQIDILQVDFPQMMGAISDIPLYIPSIFVCHEIQYVRASRHSLCAETAIEKLIWLRRQYYYKKQEVALAQKYQAIIVLTEVDKCVLQSMLPDKPIFVSPLGIDVSYYQPTQKTHTYKKIVFMGNSRHYPNVDGLRFFFKRIFPIIKREKPDINIFILGDFNDINKRALSSDPAVIWTGFVENIGSYIEGSVFIAPLRIGSGLRIKILEAMSMGCPVVSTSVGCEGIPAHDGRNIFIEDNPNNFARKIIYLIENPKQAMKVGQNAKDMAVREYNWVKAAQRREKVYREVLALPDKKDRDI